MQKGNTPAKYLAAIKRLARLSRDHGLNWATNIILGHPGETLESMQQTHAFMTELFTEAKATCGWLSIDPFRLYPGAHVHEFIDQYERDHGAKFHHPSWWKSWYDGSFRAEHVDPSASLSFEDRVRFMYEKYPPLVDEIARRFQGQGRSVDRVFKRSLAEQARLMSPQSRDALIRRGRVAREQVAQSADPVIAVPIGLHVRDPWIRRREEAVRRLLEAGAMRTEVLIEALLQVAPEDHLPRPLAEAMLADRLPEVQEGEVPPFVGFHAFALGLEALNPGAGEVVADLTAVHGYVAAVLSEAVGADGQVIAVHPKGRISAFRLRSRLSTAVNVKVQVGQPLTPRLKTRCDAIWLGGALPNWPSALTPLLYDGGRAVTLLGPRFRHQDLVCLTRDGDALSERIIARSRAAVVAGPGGWVRSA
jgi:protein-L-isoaspartate O-methyltransferase